MTRSQMGLAGSSFLAVGAFCVLVAGCAPSPEKPEAAREGVESDGPSVDSPSHSSASDSDSVSVSSDGEVMQVAAEPVGTDVAGVQGEATPGWDGSSASDSSASDSSGQEAEGSPEAVLRAFLLALLCGDREAGSKLILPTAEMNVLWPPNRSLEVPPGVEQSVAQTTLQRLAIGDRVDLPGGQSLVMDESHINENRQQIRWDNQPIPFILVRKEDGWKVDAGMIVASRKAAQKVMQEKP